jgi:hypothetical protein
VEVGFHELSVVISSINFRLNYYKATTAKIHS